MSKRWCSPGAPSSGTACHQEDGYRSAGVAAALALPDIGRNICLGGRSPLRCFLRAGRTANVITCGRDI